MATNPYDSTQLDDFTKKRKRLLKSKSGIEDNNRRVRLLGFERAMKEQFGPNVVVDPSGMASRNGEVVGNFDDYIKAGGALRGTPKDTRSKLSIEKAKEEEADKNFDFEKAASVLDTGSNRNQLSITDFEESKEESTKSTMKEIENIMAAPESLDDVLKKSLTGTDEASAGATNSTMQDQLRDTTGRLEQLRILQEGGVKTGPQGMVDTGKGFASVKTAKGNKALKKQLAKLKAQKLAQMRIGG